MMHADLPEVAVHSAKRQLKHGIAVCTKYSIRHTDLQQLQGLGVCLALLGLINVSVASRHLELPLPMANVAPCQARNLRLSSFLKAASEEVTIVY